MADNVSITPGSGNVVAADEVVDGTLGTVKVQYVKLMDGTLDGTSKAAVGPNGLKVDPSGVTSPISAISLPLPTGAAQDSTLTGGTVKTQLVDGTGDVANIGSVSKGVYEELIDSSGKLIGAAKTLVSFRATNFTAATTEAMITLTPSRNGVDGTPGTSFTITAGKRLRLLGMTCITKNAGAATQGVIARLRINPSGAVVVTSPILSIAGAGTSVATANNVGFGGVVPMSSGDLSALELPDTFQLGVSQIGTATAGNDFILWGYEY